MMLNKLTNCKIICPDSSLNGKSTLYLSDDGYISSPEGFSEEIKETDCGGKWLMPAFTDIGCSFYNPDFPQRDSLESANASADRGGYCRLVTLCGKYSDSRVTSALRVKDASYVMNNGKNIYFAPYFSFDNDTLFEIFNAIRATDSLFISSSFDPASVRGALGTDRICRMLGVPEITKYDECQAVAQVLVAAKHSGCRVHFTSLSCIEALDMVLSAKASGTRASCGVSVFHLCLNDTDTMYYGQNCKLLPPLRSKTDKEALVKRLEDFDCISSLHTPLTDKEKNLPMAQAPFGMMSIEHTFSALLTYLPSLKNKPEAIVRLMSQNPSRILGIDPSFDIGCRANFLLIDPDSETVVSRNTVMSKCSNTPFLGQTLNFSDIKLFRGAL